MRNYLTFALIFVVIVLGTVGYSLLGMPFYAALIRSLSLLTLGAALEPTNILIEIGRWLGVLFVLNVVYTVVEMAILTSADDMKIRLKARKPDAVAIHGDGVYADKLAKSVGSHAIKSDRESSFKAPIQVVFFSNDKDTLAFYSKNYERMAKAREIYVGLAETTPVASKDENVFVFRMPDICAHLYWEQHPVEGPEKVVLIGDDPYAQALLTQGLMVNVFSVAGGVQYRVFGDFGRYRRLHPMLDSAMDVNDDTLAFEDGPWSMGLDDIRDADRIIICGPSEVGLETVSQLRRLGVRSRVYLRCDSESLKDLMQRSDATVAFGTADELATAAIVLQQEQHGAGKRRAIAYLAGTRACDGCRRQPRFPAEDIGSSLSEEERSRLKRERLAHLDYEACLGCPVFLEDWRSMGEFLRQSNYAVAAHDAQKARLVEGYGVTTEDALLSLPQEDLDVLLEIEHIRWCRFYFLNNWKPGPRDDEEKTHHCLVPFDQLSRETKDLDIDSYRTLFNL